MNDFEIFIPGIPAPQGSKRFVGTFVDKKTGRTKGRMIESSKKVGTWRQDVVAAFTDKDGQAKIKFGDAAVIMRIMFVMPRPASTPKRKPTPAAIRKPDLDKLLRAVFDALKTAGVWNDDARCVGVLAVKIIAEQDETPGAHISLAQVNPDDAAVLRMHDQNEVPLSAIAA